MLRPGPNSSRTHPRATALVLCLLAACEPAAPPATETPSEPPPAAPPLQPPPGTEPGLHVVLLGTGTPIPDPRRAGPSTAIVINGRAYLFDAGGGVLLRAEAAYRQGIAALRTDRLARLFLTHLHSDHTVGVVDVLRSPAVIGREEPLQIYGPRGTAHMVEHLQQAMEADFQVRLRVGADPAGYAVHVQEVTTPGPVYEDGHVRVEALRVRHGLFDDALGYRIEGAGRRVVISGDTAPSETVVHACDGCDLLVHEVYCEAGLRTLEPEVQAYHTRFHTSSSQLAALAERARPKLLVLTHLLDFGCSHAALLREVRQRYSGDVVLGEDLVAY